MMWSDRIRELAWCRKINRMLIAVTTRLHIKSTKNTKDIIKINMKLNSFLCVFGGKEMKEGMVLWYR